MNGTDANTGKALSGDAHLRQSIGDILSTPVGSRVMRRDYGSLLPQLVDQPFHRATVIRLLAASATALMRWEPRLRLSAVSIDRGTEAGSMVITVQGTRTDLPVARTGTVTVPLLLRAVQ